MLLDERGYDERGYSVAANEQRARYKLVMSRAHARVALEEARLIGAGVERDAWLRIARESRSDARYWVRQLRKVARS